MKTKYLIPAIYTGFCIFFFGIAIGSVGHPELCRDPEIMTRGDAIGIFCVLFIPAIIGWIAGWFWGRDE